jgi:hypothetical protein
MVESMVIVGTACGVVVVVLDHQGAPLATVAGRLLVWCAV